MKDWLMDHLNNPSDNCLCHKYETVNTVRKEMVNVLEDWF